jgi:hypothetical protein
LADQRNKRERRVLEGWEDYLDFGATIGAGRPVPRLWKPLNPPETSVEEFVGREAVDKRTTEKNGAVISSAVLSAKLAILASLIVAGLCGAGLVLGVISLALFSPFSTATVETAISLEMIFFGAPAFALSSMVAVRKARTLRQTKSILIRSRITHSELGENETPP